MLKSAGVTLKELAVFVQNHHERYDGKGCLKGIK